MSISYSVPVALAKCPSYEPKKLASCIPALLEAAGIAFRFGEHILVKPNLVAARGALACTQPAIAAAVCTYLQDHGVRITVADSPAFGSAAGVAAKCGLAEALQPLGLTVETLGDPTPLHLTLGGSVGVSRLASEVDRIMNLPRLKAHCQMRITAATKNLFGCVCGMRKAIAHTRFGERGNRFESMIVDVCEALAPVVTVLDGITAMHKSGPTGGEPFRLGLLGVSANHYAMDTALYQILGLSPDDLPVWHESQRRGIAGTRPQDLSFPLASPQDFDATNFIVPQALDPVSFRPARLATGALKRLYARLR